MENLILVSENDPILSKPAEPWDWEKDGEVMELAAAMLKCMYNNRGIGLAAPQVGISKRILVMGNPDASYVCVNPEILDWRGKDIKGEEGCLSYPGLYLHVARHDIVRVKYQDPIGKEHTKEFSGIMSRVFQHEYDHLEGHCFIEKVGKLSLSLAQERRRKNLRKAK